MHNSPVPHPSIVKPLLHEFSLFLAVILHPSYWRRETKRRERNGKEADDSRVTKWKRGGKMGRKGEWKRGSVYRGKRKREKEEWGQKGEREPKGFFLLFARLLSIPLPLSSSFSLPFLLPWSFVPHRLAIKSPFHKTTSKSKHFCNILQEKSAIILRQVFFAKFSRKNCNKNSYLKKNFLFPTNNKITITG